MFYTFKELAEKVNCCESVLRAYLGRAEFSHLHYVRNKGIEIKDKKDIKRLELLIRNRKNKKRKNMYELKVGDKYLTCPETSLIALALHRAIKSDCLKGNICDEQTAIEYFKSEGIEVKKIR